MKARRERLEDFKRDKDALLERYANVTTEAQEELSPEERNKLYKMLRLRVVLRDDGTPEESGVLCEDLELQGDGDIFGTRNDVPTAFQKTRVFEVRFRALVTKSAPKDLELTGI